MFSSKLKTLAVAAPLMAAAISPLPAPAGPVEGQILGAIAYAGIIPMIAGLSPRVWYPAPVIGIPPGQPGLEPIYLNVPNLHRLRWEMYCSLYNACYLPVYFVLDDWYRGYYVPHYRRLHPHWYRSPQPRSGPGHRVGGGQPGGARGQGAGMPGRNAGQPQAGAPGGGMGQPAQGRNVQAPSSGARNTVQGPSGGRNGGGRSDADSRPAGGAGSFGGGGGGGHGAGGHGPGR